MAYNKLIFELSVPGRIGYQLTDQQLPAFNLEAAIGSKALRTQEANLPEVSELDIVRHYTMVSQKNIGIESGFYPLGSCTMKYNPKINDQVATMEGFTQIHPLQPLSTVQGLLKIYDELATSLSEISGMAAFSLNPFAGAHGELAGLMIMKAYHDDRKDFARKKVIVPDAAHGTNPASAMILGYDILVVKSTAQGTVDVAEVKKLLSPEIAGIMLTNPNTLGLFEKDILELSQMIHSVGGLLYYDGANLNAMLGVARPGDMGFDIMHINLHKTFSTPHGGGGPGSGPVGVCEKLVPYLPSPRIVKNGSQYTLEEPKTSSGRIGGFLGNFLVEIRAYAYIRTMGEHLMEVGPTAILNANYIQESLKTLYKLPIQKHCMHELVFNGLVDQSSGVKTLDVAKRTLDFGIHAPTIYFPMLFEQSIMIEPTEVESKQTLDQFIAIFKQIAEEAKTNPKLVLEAPHHTPVGRLDEVGAARTPILTYAASQR